MNITSEGDHGDLVYLFGIVKAIPNGPHSIFIEEKSENTAVRSRQIAENLVEICGPLALSQPYIKEFRMLQAGDKMDWRSGGFRRERMHDIQRTLLSAHLRHYNKTFRQNMEVDTTQPWLEVEPSKETKGMVVVNRTTRYRNRFFPWKSVVEHYGNRIVFVGLPHEHQYFSDEFGYVSFREAFNLLEVAQLIKGSELFIGNQSCANACAEGMKHPSIQETSLSHPDCIFRRTNAQYVIDGECVLPDVSGSGECHTPRAEFKPNYLVQTSNQPRSGWVLDGLAAPTHKQLLKRVMAERGLEKDEAHRLIIDALWEREREYFGAMNHEEHELQTAFDAYGKGSGLPKRTLSA